MLRVTDNGLGIPAAYRDKIFDKFFRVRMAIQHNVKGMAPGLGLWAHIIKEHHGSILVESEEGKGTSFIIKLPREYGSQPKYYT